MVLGWFKHIIFIVHFISITIIIHCDIYEITVQLTIMQNQWKLWACFPELGQQFEWWGVAVNTDEASLAHLPLSSCYVAKFLTGQGPVLVCGPGIWGPHCKAHTLRWEWTPPHSSQKVRWEELGKIVLPVPLNKSGHKRHGQKAPMTQCPIPLSPETELAWNLSLEYSFLN